MKITWDIENKEKADDKVTMRVEKADGIETRTSVVIDAIARRGRMRAVSFKT